MRIALVGTRGVPARYGGFETAVEEVGSRLAGRGHEVLVTCRDAGPSPTSYRGMQLIQLPVLRRRALETLNNGVSSALALRALPPVDAAVVFNAANALVIPMLKATGAGVALHVDGLEWRRAKWSGLGRLWYLAMERYGARHADELVADARAIQDYYEGRYRVGSVFIPYGAVLLQDASSHHVEALGLDAGAYDLVVARLEPENHVDVAMNGHLLGDRAVPLVVVGSVPYESLHLDQLRALAGTSASIRMLGGIWDQDQLDALLAHCRYYIHGHSVGGTNPVLLRAMGASAPTLALDVVFNREVLAEAGLYFSEASALAELLQGAEPATDRVARGRLGRERVETRYRWDEVADAYEAMCERLASRR